MIARLVLLGTMLLLPSTLACLDLFGGLRARHKRVIATDGHSVSDFNVLVPIWGSLRYLENVAYLASYGSRVILCTTDQESEEFNREINELSRRLGFQVFRARGGRVAQGAARATSGTVRDRIIRDAHEVVTEPFVVCIDADTVTDRPLGELVHTLQARRLDFCSVRLIPSNDDSLLARLQVHEYRQAMLLRRIMPWLVSGACHAARSDVHRQVMQQHSLFFQGNDVEVGLLADKLGYRVGHIAFDVPTTVPSTLKPWMRQRLAWAGGEVRLFLANPQLMIRHPFWWAYGALVTIGGFPLRWEGLVTGGYFLFAIPSIYALLLLYVHRGHWNWLIFLMPFYSAFSSLVLTPVGLYYYVRMAWADKNAGLIRCHRVEPEDEVQRLRWLKAHRPSPYETRPPVVSGGRPPARRVAGRGSA